MLAHQPQPRPPAQERTDPPQADEDAHRVGPVAEGRQLGEELHRHPDRERHREVHEHHRAVADREGDPSPYLIPPSATKRPRTAVRNTAAVTIDQGGDRQLAEAAGGIGRWRDPGARDAEARASSQLDAGLSHRSRLAAAPRPRAGVGPQSRPGPSLASASRPSAVTPPARRGATEFSALHLHGLMASVALVATGRPASPTSTSPTTVRLHGTLEDHARARVAGDRCAAGGRRR